VLFLFVLLLALANEYTDGERFYGAAPLTVTAIAMVGLFGLQRLTAESDVWRFRTSHIAAMTAGAVLYTVLAYVFNDLLALSIGQVVLSPQVCVPVLCGYAFGPIVGFFTGAVGTLLGDFATGWGVFPTWDIGNGVTGMVPGLVTLLAGRKRGLRDVSVLVVVVIASLATIVFIHPRAPEPWTGEIQDFSFWAWALLIGGVVMVANGVLLEQLNVPLAAVNLWGTFGIIAGTGFASLAAIWVDGYSLATALVGEFAPAAATDILNLMLFAPLVLAGYRAVRARKP
jgi:uncharacterized membrane protein